MITTVRTNSDNLDFIKLVEALDLDLEVYYKDESPFYKELNTIDKIQFIVVAYNEKQEPVGCGGIKEYFENCIEIKRMYVPLAYRGRGVATQILNELEIWSKELNYQKCILQTLKNKPYAIAFYKKNHYKEMPNFGEYINAQNSICFEKQL